MRTFSRRSKISGLGVLLLIVAGAASIPMLMDFQTISVTREQFLLEDAVHAEIIGDSVHKPSIDEVLNPSFLKRYNLSIDDYLDPKGYFVPNGNHWQQWSLETKTAAVVLMWRTNNIPSTWQLRRVIRRVDDYYSNNDRATPVVKVVAAAEGQ